MSWINTNVRARVRKLVTRSEVPDNLWTKCPSCAQMIMQQELDKNLNVCTFCDHHLRLSPQKRLEQLFDSGDFETIALPSVATDPLKFRDLKRYTDRLRDSQLKTKAEDALLVGFGAIEGHPLVIAAFNFAFMGGSMGTAVGEGLLAAADKAVAENAPLLVIPASGGARMQEGILSLMQMPRTVIAVERVREAGLPYMVLLTDPTTGGVTASFAMLGDIHIAEPGAVVGFAGARVIEETIREKLPEGFQRAEYLEQHGIVDMVVHRRDLRATLGQLIDMVRTKFRADAISLEPEAE